MIGIYSNQLVNEGKSIDQASLIKAIEENKILQFLSESDFLFERNFLDEVRENESEYSDIFQGMTDCTLESDYGLTQESNGYSLLIAYCIELLASSDRLE